MTKFTKSLLMLGAVLVTANAQDTDKAWYLKANLTLPFAETKDYLGGKSNGWGFEGGYDFGLPDDFSFITPWVAYSRFVGNVRKDYPESILLGLEPAALGLDVYQIGLNFKYQTNLTGLRLWAGISVNWFDGNQITAGYTPGELDPADNPRTDAHGFGENKAKLGLRIGADYHFTSEWSAHLSFDASAWRSDPDRYVPGALGNRTGVHALNPMRPSWFAISVGYHF
ncbi:MAG: porin family protein [Holophagaceae bacterium]|nr:porin family protein [Holophagaceae bacterium]